jgi:peptide chain release factor 1
LIESLVDQIETRFAELSRAMTDPEVIGDRRRYADVGREYRRLEPAARLAEHREGLAHARGSTQVDA